MVQWSLSLGLPPSLPDATIWCSMTPANSQPSTTHRPRVGIPWRTSHEEVNHITNKLQYYFAAVAAAKPVLAICYGCQSLNVSLGGTLYQDIASELHTSIEHSKEGLPAGAADPIHPARIEPGGEIAQLAAIAGLAKRDSGFDVQVNTSHHQAVRDLGHGLRVAALAPDGVVEAVEHEPHKHWVVGVQWHPERMKGDPLAAALFRALVQATRATVAHR